MSVPRVLEYRAQTTTRHTQPADEVTIVVGKLYKLAGAAPWCIHAANVFITTLLALAESAP